MNEMTVYQHINEVRSRFIKVSVLGVISFLFFMAFSEVIIKFLVQQFGVSAVFGPMELLGEMLKVSFYLALFITVPYGVYHILKFINPAYPKLTNKTFLIVGSSFILFTVGSLIGYFFSLYSMGFFRELSLNVGVVNLWNVENTIGYVLTTLLVFGLIFQLPLVMLLLTKLGLMKSNHFTQFRKPIMFSVVTLVAVISPQVDALSLLITSLPLILLYELGVLSCKIF